MAPRKYLAWSLGLGLLGVTALSLAQRSAPGTNGPVTNRPPTNLAALHAPRFAPDRVLVKFKRGMAASAMGAAHRKAGGRLRKTIPGIGVQVVEVPAGDVAKKLAQYRANPNVLYAEPDYYRVMVMPVEEPGPTPAGHANECQEPWDPAKRGHDA